MELQQLVIAMRVQNRFGVLTRISAMFSRRGFNIDSLTVSETEEAGISRVTITLEGDTYSRNQIIKQLFKLTEVMEIAVMLPKQSVVRELLLIKVRTTEETRRAIMDAAEACGAMIVDYTATTICLSLTEEPEQLNNFIRVMEGYGILELCRTGVIALERGECLLREKDMEYIKELEKTND